MEFEEMQKIWDAQNNRTLYAIDENTLSDQITSRKKTAHRTINFSELLVIFTHLVGTGILLVIIWKNDINGFVMNLMTAWMFVTAILATIVRVRRIYSKARFDRSMFGELDHAISLAKHQVYFSSLMRWNSLPIAGLAILLVWQDGKSIWIVIGMTIFFLGAYFASQWEVKIYKRKKEELEKLKVKLEEN
jgi:sensor c-di-GMP phosphodiesterase-like protein